MKLDAEASLLRRVLPDEIIARVQESREGELIADAHESLTFLFSDLVSFTEMCSVTPVSGRDARSLGLRGGLARSVRGWGKQRDAPPRC